MLKSIFHKVLCLILFILISDLNDLFAQELYPYLFSNNKWGFVDKNFKTVVKGEYEYAHPFIEGLAAVQKNELWGFINKQGKPITKFIFYDLYETSEGLIPVCNLNGKWGYLNTRGMIEIPFLYDNIAPFKFGLAPVLLNGSYAYIDKNMNIKFPGRYTYAREFILDGYANVLLGNEGFIIDTLGKKYPSLGSNQWKFPSEGLYFKRTGILYGFYDAQTDQIKIPHEYEKVDIFSGGLAPVMKNGKWGFIDKENNLIIEFQFDDARPFSEGLAAVRIGEKKGYINQKGEMIIKPQFDSAGKFKHGVAEVSQGDIDFYVTKNGQLLIER
ncbi:MAG: WG repeat-containing protein [Cytophagales bacterium]